MSRTASNRDAVLRALQNAGDQGCLTAQLCHPSCGAERFGARIEELRKDGWAIKSEYHRVGSWRYTLTGLVGAASETPASPGLPLPAPVTATPAPPRPALGTYHACDACGYRHRASWPRECPSCHANVIYLASFHTRFACEAHEPIALAASDERAAA